MIRRLALSSPEARCFHAFVGSRWTLQDMRKFLWLRFFKLIRVIISFSMGPMLLGLMLAAPLNGIILFQAWYFFANFQRLYRSSEAFDHTHVLSSHQRQAQYESFSGSTKSNVYYPTDRPIDPTGRINNSGGLDAFRLDGTVLVQ